MIRLPFAKQRYEGWRIPALFLAACSLSASGAATLVYHGLNESLPAKELKHA